MTDIEQLNPSSPIYINSLTLHNIKKFTNEDCTFEFNRRVNYIIGNNNGGKTSVLQSLQFVLEGIIEGHSLEDMSSHPNLVSKNDYSSYVEIKILTNLDILKSSLDKNYDDYFEKFIERPADNEDYGCLTLRRYIRFSKNDSNDIEDEAKKNLEKECNEISKLTKIVLIKNKTKKEFEIHKATKSILDSINICMLSTFLTPSDIVSGASSPLVKLAKDIFTTNKIAETKPWSELLNAFDNFCDNENQGIHGTLHEISEKTSSLIKERFPETSISFETKYQPNIDDVIKGLVVQVNDSFTTGKLETKGAGLQRDIITALVRICVEKKISAGNRSVLILLYDEPETCLHPAAQHAFIKDCNNLETQQFIATHSPYMLTKFDQNCDSCYIINSENGDVVKSSKTNLGILRPGEPSLAEITYLAFGIPTIEFHSELYSSIHSHYLNNGQLSKSDINLFDKNVLQDMYQAPAAPIGRFDSREIKKNESQDFEGCLNHDETLHTAIRNCIDHPESNLICQQLFPLEYETQAFRITESLLKESIDGMIGIWNDIRKVNI